MLYYFPLEAYKARYTCQLSAAGHQGWLESRWLENEVPYKRIEPSIAHEPINIEHGSVLDACQRGIYACGQTAEFLKYLQSGLVTSDDVIYFDDFWQPGVEALPYAFELTGIKPKMYALLHAQSVDEFDFVFKMLPWIRHFEKGIASILDGVFVSCELLADLVYKQGLCEADKIHITGLPYNSSKVKEIYFPQDYQNIEKKNQVVFSSRWDTEKDPLFFLDVIDRINELKYPIDYEHKINFVISTSHKKLKSNDEYLLSILEDALAEFPNLEVRNNQTKEDYYKTLLESKIQFNCADQDFISWTLLEATTAGCVPVYPNYRSFKNLLPDKVSYSKHDVSSAMDVILRLIEDDLFYKEVTNKNKYKEDFQSIVNYHDSAWERMWHVMYSEDNHKPYSYKRILDAKTNNY